MQEATPLQKWLLFFDEINFIKTLSLPYLEATASDLLSGSCFL